MESLIHLVESAVLIHRGEVCVMRNFVPNEHDNGVTIYSDWKPGQRVLVNGGAGFLGSHLCERLLSSGHEVICLDDLSTGRTANVEHLRNNKRFLMVEHDVRKPMFR